MCNIGPPSGILAAAPDRRLQGLPILNQIIALASKQLMRTR